MTNEAVCGGKIPMKFSSFLKRVVDVCLSLTGLALFLPFWLLITLIIYFESGRPVFYSDHRVGKDKKVYKHYKFRSMIKDAEKDSGPIWSEKEDRRSTKFGRALRGTAMDELPQLWNILKGDMSFVGPRPERSFFVEKFIKEVPGYEKRFAIRPGLTGLAQVYGKYNTPAGKKLEYDLEYIRKMNLFLDLKLIFLSFMITLSGGWARFEDKNDKEIPRD